MNLFEATKKRSNNLQKTVPCLNYNQAQICGTRGLFQPRVYLSQNSETDWIWLSGVSIANIIEKLCLTINDSLIDCAGTNSSNFTMILSFIGQNRIHFKIRKKRVFPGFFSQLPETRVLKFCSELETLIVSVSCDYRCLKPATICVLIFSVYANVSLAFFHWFCIRKKAASPRIQ